MNTRYWFYIAFGLMLAVLVAELVHWYTWASAAVGGVQ